MRSGSIYVTTKIVVQYKVLSCIIYKIPFIGLPLGAARVKELVLKEFHFRLRKICVPRTDWQEPNLHQAPIFVLSLSVFCCFSLVLITVFAIQLSLFLSLFKGSISSTFFTKLLRLQIPIAKNDTDNLTEFLHF